MNDVGPRDLSSDERRVWEAGLEAGADHLKNFFARTQNPMFVFVAYTTYPRLDRPLPGWIQDYLDISISRFVSESLEADGKSTTYLTNPQRALAEAFGIISPWNENVWRNYKREIRIFSMGLSIFKRLYLTEETAKETYIAAEVATKFKTSPSTAWRAWERLKQGDPELLQALQAKRSQSAEKRFGAPSIASSEPPPTGTTIRMSMPLAVCCLAAAHEFLCGASDAPDLKAAVFAVLREFTISD